MDSFVTWQQLATMAGAIAATKFIVDAIKCFAPIQGKQVLGAAALVGILVLLGANLALGTCKPTDIPIHVLNGVMVGFAASGFHDAVRSSK